MPEIHLTLGAWFCLNPLNEPNYYGWAANRRLITRDGRPVGHWTSETRSGRGFLWLQNYAGYNCKDFVLELNDVDLALSRAKKILAEWDANPKRPTWIA
jgi:hypothetical protein